MVRSVAQLGFSCSWFWVLWVSLGDTPTTRDGSGCTSDHPGCSRLTRFGVSGLTDVPWQRCCPDRSGAVAEAIRPLHADTVGLSRWRALPSRPHSSRSALLPSHTWWRPPRAPSAHVRSSAHLCGCSDRAVYDASGSLSGREPVSVSQRGVTEGYTRIWRRMPARSTPGAAVVGTVASSGAGVRTPVRRLRSEGRDMYARSGSPCRCGGRWCIGPAVVAKSRSSGRCVVVAGDRACGHLGHARGSGMAPEGLVRRGFSLRVCRVGRTSLAAWLWYGGYETRLLSTRGHLARTGRLVLAWVSVDSPA